MTWHPYDLDRIAQHLVMEARKIDNNQGIFGDKCFNESQKMRTTAAYGLERFWGEHLRYKSKGEGIKNQEDKKKKAEDKKAEYWRLTWVKFCEIMEKADITLPDYPQEASNISAIEERARALWNLSKEDQRICLTVLTQLCDCLVWWTQRLKPPK